MYSIQKYVLEKMKEKGIKRIELVRKAGYSNIPKGCRRFDSFINGDQYTASFINRLHIALDVSEEEVKEKLCETEQQIKHDIDEMNARQQDFERKSFVPFLFCHTANRVPHPIFVCAILGASRLRKRCLPLNFDSLPSDEQMRVRKEVIADTLKSYNGFIPTFGRILCFTQRLEYDDEPAMREVYDLNGDRIIDPDEKYLHTYEGTATLSYKGKDITMLFKEFKIAYPDEKHQ